MKKITIASLLAFCFTSPVMADEYTDTLDILLQKGILSKQEHAIKVEIHKDRLENKEFQTSRIDKDVKDSNNYRLSRVNDGSVMENGLGIKSKDGNTTAQFTGRVHMDYRSYTPTFSSGQSTDPYQDALEVRRGRFGVRGQIAKDFKYLLLANFGNDVGASSTTSTIDEFWFNYAAVTEAQLQVGTFKMPFSLEQLTSSNNIDFMERSLIGQTEGEFIPAKETGVMLHGIPKPGFTYALALSRGNVKTGVAPASGRTEGRQQSAWFTGSSALSGDTARTRQGIEAAFAWKGLKLQGEQFNFKYDPTTGADREITGHYVQAIYNITGENHNYKDGTFGWIKPNTAFTSGGKGAWQVGVRASEFNAEDITVATGKANLATSLTYGITWFLNDNVRLMANYVDTKFNKPVGTSGARVDGEKAVMFRGQISF